MKISKLIELLKRRQLNSGDVELTPDLLGDLLIGSGIESIKIKKPMEYKKTPVSEYNYQKRLI